MSDDIIIIGSGFAARQLVKSLRQRDKDVTIRLIAADSADEYNKPDLSHVFSQRLSADDLTRVVADEFAAQNGVLLHKNTQVISISPDRHTVTTANGVFPYGKLVLALGAEAVVPDVEGAEQMITLNSQQAYRQSQATLQKAAHIVLAGGGLIGTELAMDLNRAGKKVTMIDRASHLLSSLMPPEISARLQQHLLQAGVDMYLNSNLLAVKKHENALEVELDGERVIRCDAVVCAVGLKPNIALAAAAGLETRRGIVVDVCLATSNPDIFALGDCAEMEGKLLHWLQPARLAAMSLARTLTGERVSLMLPAMLIKIKTPDCPFQLAGDTGSKDLLWQMQVNQQGLVAKGYSASGALTAFVVSEDQMKQAFPLLKQLGTPAPDTQS
ncbi:NADH:flavorubredoxin reductase NorW [Erwinia sp. 9145]|uniref:NADH:flavorubredoxin reductase NorW n=1 Tax=Erwinia sp. 9145 TaxID=1500895 RepID=UPI000556DCD7|nr:NADH:flavorubredoxin reductase NorW [Erwinia sp. 9145]